MDLEKTNYDDDLDINVEDEDEFTLDVFSDNNVYFIG